MNSAPALSHSILTSAATKLSLRLTVKAEDNSDHLASSLILTETEHTFRNLTPGGYTLTVRAVNTLGQQGEPASTDFSIAAPAVPSYVELTPGYFQITATPRQAVYDPTVQYEFWFTDTQIADIRQVETDARYHGTALYWIAASNSIKPGKDYYFYSRDIIAAATQSLDAIWKEGHRYQKAGVMLGDFAQLNLFDDNAPRRDSEKLMEVLDHLNAKEGKGGFISPDRGSNNNGR